MSKLSASQASPLVTGPTLSLRVDRIDDPCDAVAEHDLFEQAGGDEGKAQQNARCQPGE